MDSDTCSVCAAPESSGEEPAADAKVDAAAVAIPKQPKVFVDKSQGSRCHWCRQVNSDVDDDGQVIYNKLCGRDPCPRRSKGRGCERRQCVRTYCHAFPMTTRSKEQETAASIEAQTEAPQHSDSSQCVGDFMEGRGHCRDELAFAEKAGAMHSGEWQRDERHSESHQIFPDGATYGAQVQDGEMPADASQQQEAGEWVPREMLAQGRAEASNAKALEPMKVEIAACPPPPGLDPQEIHKERMVADKVKLAKLEWADNCRHCREERSPGKPFCAKAWCRHYTRPGQCKGVCRYCHAFPGRSRGEESRARQQRLDPWHPLDGSKVEPCWWPRCCLLGRCQHGTMCRFAPPQGSYMPFAHYGPALGCIDGSYYAHLFQQDSWPPDLARLTTGQKSPPGMRQETALPPYLDEPMKLQLPV
mmetsp:Transcript_52273/g.124684  ORF Transcript_52273/g.124684 Transcript_52273/m.124684 type:complete len:417 (+) Transcript_52273:202-1452(+)